MSGHESSPLGTARQPEPQQEHAYQQHRLGASSPVGRRALLAPLTAGLAIAAVFVTVFLAALHAPKPHGLPLTVTGRPQAVAAVETGLDRQMPGGFRVTSAADPAAAVSAVRHRDTYATLDLSRPGTAHLTLAGANGSGVVQAVTSAATGVATGLGDRLVVTDAAPLSAGDSRGLVIFYYVFGVGLSSFLFAMFFHQAASGASLAVRVTVPLVFAAITGAGLTAVADAGFGALSGHVWAVAGLSALLSYAVTLTTLALTRLLHTAGLAVASLVFVIVGNATSGGALNWHFLPGGWRWVSQLIPAGAGVTALTNIQYFDARHLTPALLTLTAYCAISLLLVLTLPLLRLDAVHRRHHAEHAAR
jgi:hypothetical protein